MESSPADREWPEKGAYAYFRLWHLVTGGGKSSVMWIYNARILAVVMVVLGHSVNDDFEKATLGSANWWIDCVILVMRRWSVPVFLMVSGGLLLDPSKTESFRTFYRKRASRILLPLLFWSAIYTGWTALRMIRQPEGLDPWVLVKNLANGVPYYHLWYIYMLIFLYLFTPFYRMVVRSATRKQLWFLVAIGFSMVCVSLGYEHFAKATPGLFIGGFTAFTPFFFLGYLLKTTKFDPSIKWLVGINIAATATGSVGAFLLTRSQGPEVASYFYQFLSLPVIAMSASMFLLLKRWQRPLLGESFTRKLGSSTFGIYLAHAGVLDVVHFVLERKGIEHPILLAGMLTLATTVLSAAIVLVLQRIPGLRQVV